jgi:hypothetical protein
MAPLVTTVVGGMFSIPLQASLRKARPFSWGYSTLERGALISELDGRFRYIYGTDFSKFDACVPSFILKDVFSMIRGTFTMDDSLGLVWEKLVRDFIHTRIVGPDGNIYQKHHGIPSGSAFTSLVGSIVNLIVTEYIWIGATGQELPFNAIFVMGDDALFGSERYIAPEVMSRFAGELGFTLNPDKTGVTSGAGLRTTMEEWPHFLGHYWVNGVPDRPEHEVARAMALPERHRPQNRGLSDQRKAGYAMTTRQGFRMIMGLERDPRIFAAAAAIMRRASFGGAINPNNLPGTLRQRMLVEGEDMSFSEVLSCSMDEFEVRYADVTVHPERLAAARELKPIQERQVFGRSTLLFERVDRRQLQQLGDVRTPSIADVFVAVIGNSTGASQAGGR